MDKHRPEDLDRYRELADKWVQGVISAEEKKELEDWYDAEHPEKIFVSEKLAADENDLKKSMSAAIGEKAGLNAPIVHWQKTKLIVNWAAAILLMLLIPVILQEHLRKTPKTAVSLADFKGDVMPGHSGATLKLSDGSSIVLDSAEDGALASEGNAKILKEGSTLKYVGKSDEMIYNTVTTGRGRQWSVTLPDGTKVWLNAASSIRYPLSFTGGERNVELKGEAYFEVVHDSRKPFRIKVQNEMIEDIGTSFNVNAYDDEPEMRTTLVNGSIKIRNTILKPGQKAIVQKENIRVSQGNINQALAWRNGFFSFEHANIHEVMRQISRWYNVDVIFEGKRDTVLFEGEIGRSLTLLQLLKGLEQVDVHFKMNEDGRIVVQL